MRSLVLPWFRALSQLDDPAFVGVLLRGLAGSAIGFVLLAVALDWGALHLLPQDGVWADWRWLAGAFGMFGAFVLALWLFLPVAVIVAALLMDRVAAAVDRRFRPYLPPPHGAAITVQIWDGLALGALVIGANLFALLIVPVLPGVGFVIGWAVAAWAVGRGLFVAVAMRRMSRTAARARYRDHRLLVLAQGAALAAISTMPVFNLLVPVIGTAVMVHVLHATDPA